MIVALLRGVAALGLPALRRIVWQAVAIAAASFALTAIAVTFLVDRAALFGWRPLNWLLDALGAISVLALSWLLFPAIVTMILGFSLDRIAGIVEAVDYPRRDSPRRTPLRETIAATLRLMTLTILLNVLALPVYLLAPGVNVFIFLGLNGYLFGREYFEVVALRRLDPVAARELRRHIAVRVFSGGVVVALLFSIPIVNLVAPVIATAFMVHLFEGSRLPATFG